MRRTFWALWTAWVAIMRSWTVSRTASAVATHQSLGVAEPSCRARVDTRWRWISTRNSSADVLLTGLLFLTGWADLVADMAVEYHMPCQTHTQGGSRALPYRHRKNPGNLRIFPVRR